MNHAIIKCNIKEGEQNDQRSVIAVSSSKSMLEMYCLEVLKRAPGQILSSKDEYYLVEPTDIKVL